MDANTNPVPQTKFGPPPSSILSLDFVRLRTKLAAYLKPEDLGRVEAAYHFAAEAHQGQRRISGEPYISHPVAVADIVADWRLDSQALIAALLHDVMEDTHTSKQEIAERFSKGAAELVDGLSKLDKIEFQSHEEAQAENFRKMLFAMATDLRVILIKLADRLHNMRTLDCIRPDKQRRIANETLEIYAPIANRLGLNNLYRELQELSFRSKYPLRYQVLAKAVEAARNNRRNVVDHILTSIKTLLPKWGISAEIQGRERHLYLIYRTMVDKQLSFSQVLDTYSFRIVVDDVPKCYLTLGALHSLYKPVPGKFKDYLAIPKANGYQSLHTTLIGPYGTPIELLIRTREMHHIAESGVASHWLYKEDKKTLNELQKKTHSWLQSLLELQSTSDEATEFLEHVKIDLFPGEVYVFSPKGRIYSLLKGSTPVDFAYAVHTDIGNCCVACRINGDLMPLRTKLRNGDQVEIITSINANPNPAWLSYARTGKARAQIRHFLKSVQQGESVSLGERLLNQALRLHNLSLSQINEEAWKHFLRSCGLPEKKAILADIGLGKRLPNIVARRLLEAQQHKAVASSDKPDTTSPVMIRGTEGVSVQLAVCCHPIPGDPILGIIRKGQGLEVHLSDCPAVARLRSGSGRWVDVEWEPCNDQTFDVAIRVLVKHVRGALAQIASTLSEQECNIQDIHMDKEQGTYIGLTFTIQVKNRKHLAHVMRAIRRSSVAERIERLKNGNQGVTEA